jgi:pepF/M3 family oligoendopeptidase
MTTNPITWELDTIFAGGSDSPALAEFLTELTADMAAFERPGWPDLSGEAAEAQWRESIQTLFQLTMRLRQAGAFANCLVSQDVNDDRALQLTAQIDQMSSQLSTFWTRFSAAAARQPDTAWQQLIGGGLLAEIAFHLNEERELARQKMAPELETLVDELAASGYHAWDRLYGLVSGDKEVTWQGQPLSLYQLQIKFYDDPDRTVRQQAFGLFEAAWADLAKICAEALNQQAGFRLTLYKHRGWDSVLHEPLLENRLTRDSLEAMWAVIDAKSARLLDYFAAKAKLFGIDQLSWFDVHAPVEKVSTGLSWDGAIGFVEDNLRSFNPDLADFARMALDRRWVEAENRPGKRAGGYCTTFPLSKETRIFMTFNDSYNSMLTLAHELGHSYHSWVMRDMPYGAQYCTAGVAETASTLNEMVVREASTRAAADNQTRLSLLSAKLSDAAAFLMDIRARYEFELAFFEQRAKKHLSVDELSALMLTAQKMAFKEGLARYHPLFWASKLHFYMTRTPFYNFPYTFGFLFSNGVYAQALAEGLSFRERYVALLRDTGSMSTEDLARTHLGVDLTQPEFWEPAVDRVLADVDEFVALVDELS